MSPWIASIHAHGVPMWLILQVAGITSMLAWFMRRTPGDARRLRLAFIVALPGAAVGALGLGVVLRLPAFVASGFDARLLFGMGIMAYGALGGFVGAFALAVRLRGGFVAGALDRLAPPLGLLVFFGRLGCLIAGCDFGRLTAVPWAIRYPPETAAFLFQRDAGLITSSAAQTLPVHPAQAYEALVGLLMAVVGVLVERRKARPGAVLASVAATYAVGRLVSEALRGDPRPMLGPLSMPQWLSISVLACAVLWAAGGPERDA